MLNRYYEIKISISMVYAAFIAALLIVDVTGIAAYSVTAACLHEIGHIAAMTVVSIPPDKVNLRFRSAQINGNKRMQNYGRDIIVHFAGPIVNFILFFALKQINPMFSMVNLVIGAFNMLPVKRLDGGNMLMSILCVFMSRDKAEIIASTVSWIFIIPVAVMGIIIFIKTGYTNFTLIFAAVYLAVLNI